MLAALSSKAMPRSAICSRSNATPSARRRIAELFRRPGQAHGKIKALIGQNRPWRGEAVLENARGEAKTVLVRADPVFAAPGRVLGFVLLFADLTERKAAESARRRFQDGIVLSIARSPASAMRQPTCCSEV